MCQEDDRPDVDLRAMLLPTPSRNPRPHSSKDSPDLIARRTIATLVTAAAATTGLYAPSRVLLQ